MDQEQPSGERPEGFSSSIRHRSAAAAPKLPTPYHLMLQRDKLLTSGFHTPTARTERCRSSLVQEAWTDIGDVGAGRRSDLTRNESFRQISTTLGWTPPATGSLFGPFGANYGVYETTWQVGSAYTLLSVCRR